MEVKINLNNHPVSDTVNVELQWAVEITEPKSGLFPKLFRKHNRINKSMQLMVNVDSVSNDIECNKNNLFSILYKGQIYEQTEFPVSIELSEMETPFQLLFRQCEITDCKKPQDAEPRICPIEYTVSLSDANNTQVHKEKGQIDVIFEPLGVKAQFGIDVEDPIQYSASLAKERIGTFAAWLEEEFKFTPNQIADISVKLFQGQQELPGLISFDGDKVNKTITIKAGRANVNKVPIYVDFSGIFNPVMNQQDFTIETTIVLAAAYSPEVKETILKQTHFKLLKDQQGTELKKYVQFAQSERVLCDTNHSIPQYELRFTPRSRMMGQVDVILSNLATDNSNPKAGLYIKNLMLVESVQDGVELIGDNNRRLSNLFTISGTDVDAMNSSDGFMIPNGPNAETAIQISFNPSNIVDVIGTRTYDFEMKSTLSFDYWEDADGTGQLFEDTKKTGIVPITWRLHMDPNPEWLCVDYGSSAIVCLYDRAILNLKRQKNSIFRTADDGKFRDDDIEGNTPFLSSDIVLHTVRDAKESTLCSQHSLDRINPPYLGLSVCLSPTSSLIKNDVRTQLPCLKILVGNEFLPEKPDFMTFQYKYRNEQGQIETIVAKDAMGREEKSCILRISTIFNEAYASLFRYFIMPESQDKTINRLALTYPNTYTPAHLRILEQIARSAFPKVRDGYLRFVSESDAVAAYYLNNWDKFNPGKSIKNSETVLVFDMGAGTLDITLFKKSINRQENKIQADIMGKIGTGKAGNYLDYLISEIIRDKISGAVHGAKTVSIESVPDVQILNERLDLKQAVKNDIKPKLKPGIQLHIGSKSFPSSVILNDDRFKAFLSQVTGGIISQLLKYIGTPDIKIDTILMSGRSCRLEALQLALEDALNDMGNSATRIVRFDEDSNQEKTIVVEGAMARAGIFSGPESRVLIRSRRLYASYGLIYQRLGGRYTYAELLKSSDLPFITDAVKLDSYDGPNVTVTGTAASSTLKLIQTYLSPEDTEEAFNNGDFEFISEMEEYNMADFGNTDTLNVKLRLDYKNNISLYVNGRTSIGSSPKGVDLASEITKKSIWPVTI